MNILFANEYAYPHTVSGAEFSMMALADELRKNHQVFVLSPDLGGLPAGKAGISQDLKFPFFKKITPGKILSPVWFNNPLFWFSAAYHIVCAVRNKKINLIHVHGKYIQPSAILAGWLTGKPVVTTVRDFKFLCPLALCFLHKHKFCTWANYLNSEIPEFLSRYGRVAKIKLIFAKLIQDRLKWWLNRSAAVIAVSPQLKKIYEDNGVSRVSTIYNLPSIRLSASRRIAQGHRPQKKTLVSVGKLSYGKGTDSLIEAMRSLPEYELILAGELNPSLKSDFSENVKYLGKISHEQALKLYGQADAFAILSRWPEPLSRAGLEALSAGLPIIASNRGGNNELVKDNGVLVDPDDITGVKSGIRKILRSDLKILSRNSLRLYQTRFSRSRIIDKHLKLYQSLL